MTEAQAVESLLQRWIDIWPGLQPFVPYVFDNEVLDAPETWARVTVLHTVRNQATTGGVGSRRFDSKGNVFVQLFCGIDVGRKPLADLAESVRSVYEGIRLTDLTLHASSTRESPSDARWAMSMIVTPFWYISVR